MKPTPEAVEEAKKHPNGWVYAIGEHGPDDYVPPEAVRGAWAVDHQGNITGDFVPNPNFVSGSQNA